MTYEVELKFPVENPQAVIDRIEKLGAVRGDSQREVDLYFNHPSRDFSQTDEAFRIRTVDGQHRVTYKGPLVDKTTKTRREMELPFGKLAEDGERMAAILRTLGFRETRTVRKTRTFYKMTWDGLPVEICSDSVDELGTFIELETMADDAGLEAARDSLLRLAEELGLENSERRSYLCLLLEADER